jgi:hypothetical protein
VEDVDRTAYHTPDAKPGRRAILVVGALLLGATSAALAYRPLPAPPSPVDGVIDLDGHAIALPIASVGAASYLDGGTCAIVFDDARGAHHAMTLELDGSVRYGSDEPGAGTPVDRDRGRSVAWFALDHGANDPADAPRAFRCRSMGYEVFPRNFFRLLRRVAR